MRYEERWTKLAERQMDGGPRPWRDPQRGSLQEFPSPSISLLSALNKLRNKSSDLRKNGRKALAYVRMMSTTAQEVKSKEKKESLAFNGLHEKKALWTPPLIRSKNVGIFILCGGIYQLARLA